jgi:hypothetical protein
MISAPVVRSKLNFHGLRNPYAQISPPRASLSGERIVWRHAVGDGIDADPQQLAEQYVAILRIVVLITAAAAVADADIQIALWPEGHVAAVVIAERMRHVEKRPFAGRIRKVLASSAPEEFRDNDGAVGLARVVDVELAIGAVKRMERKAKEAALAARQDLRRYIEKRRGEDRAVLDDLDDAALLDHKKASAAVASVSNLHRAAEAACDEAKRYRRRGGGRTQR